MRAAHLALVGAAMARYSDADPRVHQPNRTYRERPMSKKGLSRRDFAKLAAVSAIAAAPGAAPAAQEAAQPATDAQALFEMIRARYGKHLDAEQLKQVQAAIASNLRAAERLRKFSVGQDDPAFAFSADVP